MGKELESALRKMKEKYGETTVFKADEKIIANVEVISSGSLALDAALLVGGYPKGRIVEVSGPESGGKSFLCLIAIKKAQEKGITCAYVDSEHTFDPNWAGRLGIKVDESLIITKPEFFEDALNQILILAKTGEVGLIVWDSVAASPTKSESGKDIGEASVGVHAKVLTNALRQMTPIFHKNGVTGLFINQLRDKIGVMYGNPETTPGGRALKHFASVRVGVSKVGSSEIKDELDRVIGHKIRARVKKNKVSTAQGIAVEFTVKYTEGIDKIDEVISVGIQCGAIQRPNNKTYVVGTEKIIGAKALTDFLTENPKVVAELEQQVMKAMREGVKTAASVPEGEGSSDDDKPGADENFLKLE